MTMVSDGSADGTSEERTRPQQHRARVEHDMAEGWVHETPVNPQSSEGAAGALKTHTSIDFKLRPWPRTDLA